MKRFLIGLAACSLVGLFIVFCSPLPGYAQSTDPLTEGIRQYQADNYEEAVELLKKARRTAPASTAAAFWLGMTYKQQNNFQEAVPPLTDAVTMAPPLKEALVELIDCLYRLDRFDEAAKWLAVAEKDNIYPAKTAFLKGMIKTKQGKYGEAIQAFENSKALDKTYTQAADFQIGLCFMLDRKYAKASDRFRTAVTQDPLSDLGSFARRYQDLVEDRRWIERPLRLTLDIMEQYDTNMLTEPYAYPAFPGLTAGDEKSFVTLSTLRLDFVPILPGSWLFNASYAGTMNLYEKNSTSYNMLANTLSIAPGYSFGRFAVNLAANYTNTLRRQPSYRNYNELFGIGPMIRILLTEQQNHIIEIYTGYANKHYANYRQDGVPTLSPAENQTSSGFDSYLSWMWLFQNGAMLNLKYGYSEDHADGNNWSNKANRFTVNTIVPLWKGLKLQLGGELTLQDYLNNSTWYVDAAGLAVKRWDRIYMGTAGLIWDVNKYLSLLAQYTGTRDESNIPIYDYNRSLYSIGLEFRY